jgi:hypothetical protein
LKAPFVIGEGLRFLTLKICKAHTLCSSFSNVR